MPLHKYASLDTPLLGVQLTQLQGGQVLGFSFLHRLSDGLADTIFIASLACVLRNEEPPFEMYYDWQRPPLQPNPKYDHSVDYPVMNEKPQLPTVEPDHNVKRVFVINRDKADELKRNMEHEMPGTNIKISVRDAITAFMYRAIVKAKRVKGKCDFVYVVGKRLAHPDTRLLQHFGNYFVAVTVPEQHDTLMRHPMSFTAQRIREQVAKVNPEFMDSLEYYLNHVEDPTKVCPPAHRMTPGCVMWSDWSRFSSGIDFGYGKNSRWCRSFVNPSFWPVVTLAPTIDDSFEIVVQLDPESMDRLMHDKQVQYYTAGVF